MEEFNKAREYLIEKGVESPVVGIVLGSGLNNLMKHVDVKLTIPYADIPGFPISTVEFHKGNLVFGTIGDKNVLIMHGRMHAYEGYSLQEIVFR